MATITEGWGGNRVWDGSQWMELYYAMDADLYDGPVVLTGNGKIPNDKTSVLARLKVNVVFDAATLDTSNNFQLSGSWPAFNGSVDIPTTSEVQLYNNTVLVYPFFGETYNLRATASLSGVDRVPGTTSFDKWLSMPPRAWATPNVPTITGYSFNSDGSIATVSISGHQRDTAQDRYWQKLDQRIYHSSTGWVESLGGSGGDTARSFSNLVGNREYQVTFRTWNEDGGVSAWCTARKVYTKPAAPTLTQVKRKTADLTKVDISFTNGAAYPGTHKVERRMTPSDSWSLVANVLPPGDIHTDTVPTGSTPEYRVRTASFDGKLYSDYSNVLASDAGSIKQYIPGVNEIYHGGEKITRVYYQGTMIWMS